MAKVAKKLIFFSLFLTALAVSVGCGKAVNDWETPKTNVISMADGIGTDTQGEDAIKYFYEMEEENIPLSRLSLSYKEGEQGASYDPIIRGKHVLGCTRVSAGTEMADIVQVYRTKDNGWTSMNDTRDPLKYVQDGIEYQGITIDFFATSTDALYTKTYYHPEEGGYQEFLAQMKEGGQGIDHVIAQIPQSLEDVGYHSTTQLYIDSKERMYYFNQRSNVIEKYNCDFDLLDTITVNEALFIYGLAEDVEKDILYWYGIGKDSHAMVGNLTDGKIIIEGFEGVGMNFWGYVAQGGKLFLADNQNIWRIEEGEAQKAYSFPQNSYLIDEIYGLGCDTEDNLLVMAQTGHEILLLHLVERDAPVVKKEVTLALARKHNGLANSISRFNRSSKEYIVKVLLPEDEKQQSGFIDSVQRQISTGEGPDLISAEFISDYDSYAQNAYLTCVDDIVEEDSAYLNHILNGYRVDGKLYGVPYEGNFDFVSYDKNVVGERTSITLNELMKLVETSQADVLGEQLYGTEIVYMFALCDDTNTTYIDWKNKESHLTEQPFLDLLEFAKKYQEQNRTEEKFFLKNEIVPQSELSFTKQIFSFFQGEALILGYPREKGNGIYLDSRGLFINASAEQIQGAKEFLQYLISEKEQTLYADFEPWNVTAWSGQLISGEMPMYPIHKAAFHKYVEEAVDRDTRSNTYYDGDRLVVTDMLYTDQMVEQIYFMAEHAEPRNDHAEAIQSMVYEELTPYFEGEVTAIVAAEKLQNRVQLFLNETN